MSVVPKTSKEQDQSSISDGTSGLNTKRLKNDRTRKVQREHKDFKQSFERFLNFNFQNKNDLSIQTSGSRELSNTGGCQQNNAGNYEGKLCSAWENVSFGQHADKIVF